MHCLVSESSVQCAFLELWTYLDKSLLQSKFFQHLIFYVHCAESRWRSQWNEKKYQISALLESQFGRYGLGDSD